MSTNEDNKQKKFFYGWVIVAVCLLVQAIPFGVGSNLPPTFINYVVKAEGFSFASFSLMFTIGTIISAVCSPFIGKLFTKVNVKVLYIIASILVGVGFMAFAFAGNHLIAYYILAGIVQVGVATMSSIGVPTLINAWFKVNKGTAMGIAFSGGGLGNIFLQMIAGKWLSDPAIGYKGAYIRFGAIALVISLILSIFFVRMPKSKEELEANIPIIQNCGILVASETVYPQLIWCVALQFIAYLQSIEEAGILLIPSARIASMFGLFSIFGSILGGMLFDKLGLAKSYSFAGILVVIACLCLIFIPNMNFLGYVFPICFGISLFAYIMGPSYMTGVLFGDREYSAILGIIQIFFALGFAIGSPIFGATIDNFGWTVGWITTIIYTIIAYIGLVLSCSMILKINKENNVIETKRISE